MGYFTYNHFNESGSKKVTSDSQIKHSKTLLTDNKNSTQPIKPILPKNSSQVVASSKPAIFYAKQTKVASVDQSSVISSPQSQVEKISQITGLDKKIVTLALKAQNWAAVKTHINKSILAIVNYTQPATEPRLYVINLKDDNLLMKLLVAHGHNSGSPDIATRFSNSPQSKMSSLGVFVTGDIYYGHHGKSRRLIGLEPHINSNALARAIVIHPAPYVTPSHVGRSYGCLAVSPSQANKLINTLSPGSVIFSYALQEDHDKNIIEETA